MVASQIVADGYFSVTGQQAVVANFTNNFDFRFVEEVLEFTKDDCVEITVDGSKVVIKDLKTRPKGRIMNVLDVDGESQLDYRRPIFLEGMFILCTFQIWKNSSTKRS